MKKAILFAAFLLPILVFLFLRGCGRNEFAIPVFYEHSADSLNAACGTSYRSPYTVADSVLAAFRWQPRRAAVIVLDSSANDKELRRLTDTFTEAEFEILDGLKTARSKDVLEKWKACVFFLPRGKSLVLLDERKRIRGYYAAHSLDEADRLTVEMKILLKKY